MVAVFRVLFICLFYTGAAMAIEEPKFTVESKNDVYEIRKYSSVIVAETKVEGPFGDAANTAFRILADYIFGNNKSKTKVEMTAPVSQKVASEKIAMTAPVSQQKSEAGFLVQFTMPSKFTMETIPEPNDSRVILKTIPEKTYAVIRYSGSWSEEHYKEKLSELQAAVAKDNIKVTGEPIFSRYNSPIALWFLRRNEIWLEVIN